MQVTVATTLRVTDPNNIAVTVSTDGTAVVSWAHKTRDFPSQERAEDFADGIAAGMRVAGFAAQVTIYVPETDDDLLDMGALDAWAQRSGGDAVDTAEVDPVERRLAREAEAGRFIAEAVGL